MGHPVSKQLHIRHSIECVWDFTLGPLWEDGEEKKLQKEPEKEKKKPKKRVQGFVRKKEKEKEKLVCVSKKSLGTRSDKESETTSNA